ncbi:MAG: hemolysin III family protein [Clostridia bacterium]|nr:hemolysin III family protein [Clostridia bacterium]
MKLSANAIPLVAYTRREEILNTATHALGLILSGFIFVQCLLPALVAHDRLRIVCGCLYFFGTTLTFLTSVAYHAVSSAERKKVLRLFDHCAIFFAVAGTATGCVPAVYDTVGVVPAVLMPVAAWGGALIGLFLTLFAFETTKPAQMVCYVATAVICAVCGAGAYKVLPHGAFYCFLGGSASLILGFIPFSLGRNRPYFHALFHIFVDCGLLIYYIGIEKYCFH